MSFSLFQDRLVCAASHQQMATVSKRAGQRDEKIIQLNFQEWATKTEAKKNTKSSTYLWPDQWKTNQKDLKVLNSLLLAQFV